jgi:hypothetical protein
LEIRKYVVETNYTYSMSVEACDLPREHRRIATLANFEPTSVLGVTFTRSSVKSSRTSCL